MAPVNGIFSINPNTAIIAGRGAKKVQAQNVSNPFFATNAFSTSYNQGELSPRVDSDLAYSPVGNVFPRLYA